jgi:hypothetical protein
MLATTRCQERECRHWKGVKQLEDYVEPAEGPWSSLDGIVPYCAAYPRGIPSRIAWGKDKHLTVAKDQVGVDVYEKR